MPVAPPDNKGHSDTSLVDDLLTQNNPSSGGPGGGSSTALVDDLLAQHKPDYADDAQQDYQAARASTPMSQGPDYLERAWDRGVASMKQTGYSAVEALGRQLGHTPGGRTLKDWGSNGAYYNATIAAENPAEVDSVEDIHSLGDIGTYTMERLVEFAPQMAALAAGGVEALGARALAAGVGKAFVKRTLSDAAVKDALGSVAEEGVSSAARKAAAKKVVADALPSKKVSALAGATLADYGQIVGQVHEELKDAGIDGSQTALIAGVPIAALDMTGLGVLAKTFFPKKAATTEAMSFAGQVARGFGLGSSSQATVQTAQQAMMIAAHAYEDPNYDIFTHDNAMRLADAGATGLAIGGTIGLAGGTFRGGLDAARSKVAKAKQEIETGHASKATSGDLHEAARGAEEYARTTKDADERQGAMAAAGRFREESLNTEQRTGRAKPGDTPEERIQQVAQEQESRAEQAEAHADALDREGKDADARQARRTARQLRTEASQLREHSENMQGGSKPGFVSQLLGVDGEVRPEPGEPTADMTINGRGFAEQTDEGRTPTAEALDEAADRFGTQAEALLTINREGEARLARAKAAQLRHNANTQRGQQPAAHPAEQPQGGAPAGFREVPSEDGGREQTEGAPAGFDEADGRVAEEAEVPNPDGARGGPELVQPAADTPPGFVEEGTVPGGDAGAGGGRIPGVQVRGEDTPAFREENVQPEVPSDGSAGAGGGAPVRGGFVEETPDTGQLRGDDGNPVQQAAPDRTPPRSGARDSANPNEPGGLGYTDPTGGSGEGNYHPAGRSRAARDGSRVANHFAQTLRQRFGLKGWEITSLREAGREDNGDVGGKTLFFDRKIALSEKTLEGFTHDPATGPFLHSLEVLTHEVGHVLAHDFLGREFATAADADAARAAQRVEIQNDLINDFEAWAERHGIDAAAARRLASDGKTRADFLQAFGHAMRTRSRRSANEGARKADEASESAFDEAEQGDTTPMTDADREMAQDLADYADSFAEWLADQASRHILARADQTLSPNSRSVVARFAKWLSDTYRDFAQRFKAQHGEDYVAPSIERWLDALLVDDVPPTATPKHPAAGMQAAVERADVARRAPPQEAAGETHDASDLGVDSANDDVPVYEDKQFTVVHTGHKDALRGSGNYRNSYALGTEDAPKRGGWAVKERAEQVAGKLRDEVPEENEVSVERLADVDPDAPERLANKWAVVEREPVQGGLRTEYAVRKQIDKIVNAPRTGDARRVIITNPQGKDTPVNLPGITHMGMRLLESNDDSPGRLMRALGAGLAELRLRGWDFPVHEEGGQPRLFPDDAVVFKRGDMEVTYGEAASAEADAFRRWQERNPYHDPNGPAQLGEPLSDQDVLSMKRRAVGQAEVIHRRAGNKYRAAVKRFGTNSHAASSALKEQARAMQALRTAQRDLQATPNISDARAAGIEEAGGDFGDPDIVTDAPGRDFDLPHAREGDEIARAELRERNTGLRARPRVQKSGANPPQVKTFGRTAHSHINPLINKTLRSLGLGNERIGVFQSTDGPGNGLDALRELYAGDADMQFQLDRIEQEPPRGRILFAKGGEAIIYVRPDLGRAETTKVTLHEIGHLVQKEYLDRLPSDVRQVLEADLGADPHEFAENFANQLYYWMRARREYKANSSPVKWTVDTIGQEMRKLWRFARKQEGLKDSFTQFMAGVLGSKIERQSGQRSDLSGYAREVIDGINDLGGKKRPVGKVIEAMDYTPENTATGEKQRWMRPPAGLEARVKQMYRRNARFRSPVIVSMDDHMRKNMKDSPAAQWIAREFTHRPGEKRTAPTVKEETKRVAGPINTRLEQLMGRNAERLGTVKAGPIGALARDLRGDKHLTEAHREARDALVEQRPLDAIQSPEAREAVAEVRQFLGEVRHELNDRFGLDIQERDNYFPVQVDRAEWEKGKNEIIPVLKEGFGLDAKAAEDIWRSAIDYRESGRPGTDFSAMHARHLTPEMIAKLRPYLRDDINGSLARYVAKGVRHGVLQKRFGLEHTDENGNAAVDPLGQIKMRLARDAQDGKLSDEDHMFILNNVVPAYLGQLGRNLPTSMRKLIDNALLYQNVRTLAGAAFTSVTDFAGLAVRTQRFGALQNAVYAMRGLDREDAARLGKLIGVIQDGITDHALNETAREGFQSQRTELANRAFFKATGMEWLTKTSRIAAILTAHDFFKELAAGHPEARKQAKIDRELDELGVTPDEVNAWFDDGRAYEDKVTDPNHRHVVDAYNRFVDTTVLEPDAGMRPVWMNDYRFVVLSHFKSFMYAFHHTILLRVASQMRDPNNQGVMEHAMPMVLLGATTLPLATLGYEARRLAFGGYTPPRTSPQYLWTVIQRAGLLGYGQLFADAHTARGYHHSALIAVGGPTVGQIGDILSGKSLPADLAEATPVLAAIPRARSALRRELKGHESDTD